MPMKLLRFGKGLVPVKKANACEAAAFWKRPGACEAAAFQERPGASEEGPVPVKLATCDTLT